MSVLRALVVEQVVHDVVADREEGAACRVSRRVLAIRTGDTAGERSCTRDECQDIQLSCKIRKAYR